MIKKLAMLLVGSVSSIGMIAIIGEPWLLLLVPVAVTGAIFSVMGFFLLWLFTEGEKVSE